METRRRPFAWPALALLAASVLLATPTTPPRDPHVPRAPGEVPAARPAPSQPTAPDYFATITDDPKLPRVLLMGDSVSIAYTLLVRAELTGIANVHRVPANCGATRTALGSYGLTRWIKSGEKWDVIVFNHGLHDASYRYADGTDKDRDGRYASPARGCHPYVPLDEYERNLHQIVGFLRQTGARLIFATTTPIPDSLAEKYVENSELPYNEAARRVMQREGVAVVDLWAAVKPQQGRLQIPRNVHFTTAGSAALAGPIAQGIVRALPPQRAAARP